VGSGQGGVKKALYLHNQNVGQIWKKKEKRTSTEQKNAVRPGTHQKPKDKKHRGATRESPQV